MGLDMYLYAKQYFWSGKKESETKQVNKLFPEMKGMKLKTISFEAGYWRKANAIHLWFVENCQNGKDDCGNYEVSGDELEELKNLCETVLKEKGRAEDLLPTKEGFFYGGVKYNEWYFDNLKLTIKFIDKCLKLNKDWYFEYHSSW